MKRYTVAEIAEANKQAGRHYFSPDTPDFFNQRLSNFHAIRTPAGRVYVYGRGRPWGWRPSERLRPWSVAEYDIETGRMNDALTAELKQDPSTTAHQILTALVARDEEPRA